MQPSSPTDFDDFPPESVVKITRPQKKTPIRVEFPPVDTRLLAEQCLGNLAFGISLLETFESTANERITRLKEQVDQRNFAVVADMAHSFKGVVGILAAEPLLDLTTSLQHAAETSDGEYVNELLPRIEHELQRLLDEIPRLRSLV